MNFWHWLTKDTTRKALHVGNLKFSDGLQVNEMQELGGKYNLGKQRVLDKTDV